MQVNSRKQGIWKDLLHLAMCCDVEDLLIPNHSKKCVDEKSQNAQKKELPSKSYASSEMSLTTTTSSKSEKFEDWYRITHGGGSSPRALSSCSVYTDDDDENITYYDTRQSLSLTSEEMFFQVKKSEENLT